MSSQPAPKTRLIMDWIAPLAFLLVATVLIRAYAIDQRLAAWFFDHSDAWAVGNGPSWMFLKNYGLWSTLAMSIGALIVFALSFRVAGLRRHRRAGLYLALVMIIGPGLIVNTTFKENWERPRPLDLVELGGDTEFENVWAPPQPGTGNSFPSGHTATAFYLFTPYFVLRRRSRPWAMGFLIAGFFFGALMGYCRMMQGAHFLSDILWAFGFVYFTSVTLAYVFRFDSRPAEPGPARTVSQ